MLISRESFSEVVARTMTCSVAVLATTLFLPVFLSVNSFAQAQISQSGDISRSFSLPKHSVNVTSGQRVQRAGTVDFAGDVNNFGSAAFSLPLPGTTRSAQMVAVGGNSEFVTVPLVGQDGVTKNVSVELSVISDNASLYGVMARSNAGVFATIADRSRAEGIVYQVAPTAVETAGATQTHTVEAVVQSAVEHRGECGSGANHFTADFSALSAEAFQDGVQVFNKEGTNTNNAASDWRAIELVTVLPTEYSAGRSDEYLAGLVLNTVAGTNLFFEQLKLVVKVSGIQILRDPATDPYAPAAARHDAMSMLETVRREWRGRSSPSRDAVAVFGRGAFGGIYGYAYPKTSCIPSARDWSVLFATQGGTDRASEVSLSATLAHELGHIVGMSHDAYNAGDTQGPYVMEASFVANPTGFSTLSQNSFELHAGHGKAGGACLSPTSAPTELSGDAQDLTFVGGQEERITIREGDVYRTPLVVFPSRSQVKYQAMKLPRRATLSTFSGVLTFRPDAHTVVGRVGYSELEALVQVSSGRKTAVKRFIFQVIDSNRSPEIVTRLRSDTISVKAGRHVKFGLRGVDPDPSDRVSMQFASARVLKTMPGASANSVKVRGANADVSWKTPKRLRGKYVLSFVARDNMGQAVRRNITIIVRP